MTKLFKPFLGRLLLEALQSDTEEHLKEMYGASKDSVIALPDDVIKDKVPLSKGRILLKGEASFGDRFEKWYGIDAAKEGRKLKAGDIVYFIPNQTWTADPKKKYHVISDEHIIGYGEIDLEMLLKYIEKTEEATNE